MNKNNLKTLVGLVLDIVLWPLVVPAAVLLKGVRRIGLNRLRICRATLLRIGLLPVRDHYYEPFVDPKAIRLIGADRALPGIDWNVAGQISLLGQMNCASEMNFFADRNRPKLEFRLNNGSFESGDAEYLYQMVRLLKPRRVFEIGSGNSTLVVRHAIMKNRSENSEYSCKHLCIEPFEAPWLEAAGVITLRKRVEDVEPTLFTELEENDLLFIDSSHVIRPQGDVLTEYLGILPILSPGVVVHVHDIFSPRDYPREWLVDRLSLWNEQYVLEAFLTENRSWQIIGALNMLRHSHYDALRRVCPHLTADREPGSFYMRKVA